jgi:multiple antibiotic resistance protein
MQHHAVTRTFGGVTGLNSGLESLTCRAAGVVESDTGYLVLAFGSLVAVLNPLATIPPFIAMTEDNSVEERTRMARRACLIACVLLLVFGLSGLSVLRFFGVTLAAFQIAGGLVLVRVAFELLQGGRALKVTAEERAEGTGKDDVSITPLGIPILCGPATITTAILLSSKAATWIERGVLAVVTVVIYVGILGMLVVASKYAGKLGETPVRISSRLMGLILVAIAVEFVLQGLRGANLGLA